ncbi:MAG TPA: MFS transporter, partial [Anaerolineales bacterium]
LHLPPSPRHRRFTLLWLGLMISVAGTQMQVWALFWHIRTLTDQPIALGGVGLARIIPVILFSLIGGAMADVVNRRLMLFFTQTAMALLALVLAILTWQGQVALWHIYLLTALQAVAISFDQPARQALVPNLVPKEDLSNAFSMTSIAFQTGAIIGPAISGLVIAYLGQAYIYFFNAVSYVAVLIALVLMGNVTQKAVADRRAALSLPAIREGVQFILHQPMILSTMIMDFFATFFSSANTLLPIYTRDILHVGAIQYGWLSAAQSIGAVAAASIMSQVHQIRRQGPTILVAVIFFGIATAFFGLARSFPLAMLALIGVGAADSVSTIIRNTIRQLQTPDYIRGRMTSVNQIFFMGGPQLGEVEAGVTAQLFGTPFAIISGGIGCIIAAGLIILRWPQIMHYNGDEPIKAGAPAD